MAMQPAPIKQTDFAKLIGVSQGRLANWEIGKHDPPADILASAAEVLHVSQEWLITGKRPISLNESAHTYKLNPAPTGRLKIVGSASAGPGNGDHPDDDELDGVPAELCMPDYCGFIVEGDSMMPVLLPGDVAVFKIHRTEKFGYVWLIRRPDKNISVKKLEYDNGPVLHSVNPIYSPEIASGVELLGFLVGIWRIDGTETIIRHNPYGIRQ